MPRISGETLTRLKQRIDLVALAKGHGVKFKPGGGPPKALCPFHSEKSPSFVVHQDPKVDAEPHYHCYGACGRSWDAISFVTERTGEEFLHVVEALAKTAGVQLPRTEETAEQRQARETEKQRVARILAALGKAQEYFTRALQADQPSAETARAYVAQRDLGDAVEAWGIGYAPKTDGVLRWLREQGFHDVELCAAYLAYQGKSAVQPFHRDRLTFPLRNLSGKVIAHIGRGVLPTTKPKYLNPGTVPEIYEKGKTLFGLHEARGTIRREGKALIVEGQIDAITMHRHGFTNAVALGGSAFGEEQANLLARAGAQRVTWLLDGDAAGINAIDRANSICLAAGLEPWEVRLPPKKDPDQCLRSMPAHRSK